MSLLRYDIAMKEKLENVFPNVMMVSNSETLEKYASDHSEGSKKVEVKVPLISFYRMNNAFNFSGFGNDPHIRRGRYVKEEKLRLKAFPILIQYQIDIWSDKRQEVDDIWREIIMMFYEEPEIDVSFEGLTEIQSYVVHLVESDNTSDISSFYNVGRMWRQTISLEVRQAQMIFTSDAPLVEKIPIRVVSLKDSGDEDV